MALRWLLTLVVVLVLSRMAWADSPTASYIFPAGAQRGTTVDVRIGALYLHGSGALYIEGTEIDADAQVTAIPTRRLAGPMIRKPYSTRARDYPQDHRATFRVAHHAAPGWYPWQVATAQGVTARKHFVVGMLPEQVEDEIAGEPIPVEITLPRTLNGRIYPLEDVDVWQFRATEGEMISCEVLSSRLAYPLDAHLEIRGPDDEEIAESDDHFGSDPYLSFRAPTTGLYSARIRDVTFGGLPSFVYRLTITNGPYLERLYPLGGQAGSSVTFSCQGQGSPQHPVLVALPTLSSGEEERVVRLGNELVEDCGNSVLVHISRLPEHVEADGRIDDEPIEVPVVVNGRIDQPGDRDRWNLQLAADTEYSFVLMSARLGSPLDASVSVIDTTSGDELMSVASTAEKPIEPAGTFRSPPSGNCTLVVSDANPDRGGPEFAYRCTVRPVSVEPGYRLTLPSDTLVVPIGDSAEFQVAVARFGGFAGEVTVSAVGLSADVTCESVTVPGDAGHAKLRFAAGSTSAAVAKPIQIFGSSPGHDDVVAELPDEHCPFPRRHVLVGTTLQAPFSIHGDQYRQLYVRRGMIARRPYRVERNGYEGPLKIMISDHQIRHLQGLTGDPLVLAPDVETFEYPFRVPPEFERNRLGRTLVMAVGQMEDGAGVTHNVSYTSEHTDDQIITIPAPCPIAMRVYPLSLSLQSNHVAEVSITLQRNNFTRRETIIELLVPEHIHGIRSDPVTLDPQHDTIVLTIECGAHPGPINMPLTIRATTRDDRGDPIVVEQPIAVAVP